MRKKLSKRKEYPEIIENIIGISTSSVVGILVVFALTFLFSLILNKSQKLPDNFSWYLMGIILVGALVNGLISTIRCKLKGIISGVVSAVPFSLFITIALLVFSAGQIESKTGILYLLIFVVSTIGGILGANTKRRK